MNVRDMINCELAHPRHDAAKDRHIRRALGMSSTRYYRALSRALDTGEILAADPGLAHRLWRVQAQRAAEREERRQARAVRVPSARSA